LLVRSERQHEVGKGSPKGVGLKLRRWGWERSENTSRKKTPLTHREFVKLKKCEVGPGAPVPLPLTPAAPSPTHSHVPALVLTQPCIKPE